MSRYTGRSSTSAQRAGGRWLSVGRGLGVTRAREPLPDHLVDVRREAQTEVRRSNLDVLYVDNLIGVLRGRDTTRTLVIGAHYDHLGVGEPNDAGDSIYNGALDNASGTAALMEIAGAYAALPQAPRRSVLFLAVTAEEQGLLGSMYYAANPLFPFENTVGGLNMDGMNNFGATRDITVVGLGMSDLDSYLQTAAATQERVLEGDREAEKGYYYRSDHFELAKEGVPMLYPGGGYDDREKGVAYGMEKSHEYTRDHYHRVSDEYDLSWNVDGAMEDMEVFFRTGLDVANSDDWPNWKEGSPKVPGRTEIAKRALVSSTTLQDVIAYTAERSLAIGYQSVERPHADIFREVSASNFRPIERVKLADRPALPLVAEGDAYSLNELTRLVYDPFPARLTVAVDGGQNNGMPDMTLVLSGDSIDSIKQGAEELAEALHRGQSPGSSRYSARPV